MKQIFLIFSILLVFVFCQKPIVVYQTSIQGDRLSRKANINWGNNNYNSDNTLIFNSNSKYQKIFGFGGAFTEAAAVNFAALNEVNKQKILNLYWGADGIQYTIGRVPMNSCDFSVKSYNFDNVTDDFDLIHFDNNVQHDQETMIPFIKQALKTSSRKVNLFVTPWSPPGWMKRNGEMTGSDQPGLIQTKQVFQSWANYYVKFINAYRNLGVEFWGLTVQNEPLFAAPWEACYYNGSNERDFLKGYLGPALRKNFPELSIMVYDHNKDQVYDFANTILSDPEAINYVDGVAFHWYANYPYFYNVEKLALQYSDKFLLATEACNCPPSSNFTTDWDYAEAYSKDIIGDLLNGAVGWTDWNLLLDLQGGPNHLKNYCNSPILVDSSTQQVNVQPTFYYMGQISKFVLPDSRRVEILNYLNAKDIVPISGSFQNGQNVQLAYCGSNISSQQFKFNLVTSQINVVGTDFCLDDMNLGSLSGSNVQIWNCNTTGGLQQKWTKIGGNKIKNEYNNLCLAVDDFIGYSGANIVQKTCDDNDDRQKWNLDSNGSLLSSFLRAPDGTQLCAQAGRVSLISAAFVTPQGDNVLVVQNTASTDATFKLIDSQNGNNAANVTIPQHSIATFIF
eukprot:TRINITY_DN2458_c0_g1_i1.p1 TRINITY_DN2458_c0_g1~~TRINITY_DN2458_c0_g1_i1.p1  ORF type:complete len:621 (+),score=175.45 TRINITY_DN2458_c0_g1_i1:33-1895(+)